MSQENIEIVRKACEDFNAFMRGELTNEAAAELLDPLIEMHWHEERTMPEFPQDLRGAAELIGYAEQRRDAFDFALEPLQFIEAPDDRVLTPISQRFRGPEGGVPLETHFFYLWTIRDGKVHRVEIYLRRADALAAAGLRE